MNEDEKAENPTINEGTQTLSTEDILSNAKLIKFAEEEIRMSEDSKKEPRELLKECLNELEQKGFLNAF